MSRLLALATLLLLASAAAQGRLNPPNYYLSQLPELQAGATLAGELTTASGQSFKDGSYLDMYVLYGEAGEQLTLLASSLEFDTYLTLFDPNGWLVASGDDSMYGTAAELTLTLSEAGRYIAVVSGYSQYDVGRYSLTRNAARGPASADAQRLELPGSYTGTYDEFTAILVPHLESPGAVFEIEVTEQVALAISASSWDFDTFLLVTDADGSIVVENDDENYSEATNWNTDSRAFAEFQPGTYYVYVTSLYSTPYGEYSVSIRRFVPLD